MSMYAIWSNKAAKLKEQYTVSFGGYENVPTILKDKVTRLCSVANKCWSYEKEKK